MPRLNPFLRKPETQTTRWLPGWGYIWSTADSGVSPAINREVAAYFDSGLVQSDHALRLRALIAKAVLDRNTNEMAARVTWEQILELAKGLGDERWEGRAKAELGQILYMDGGCSVGDHDAPRCDRFPILAVGSRSSDPLHLNGRKWIR